MNRELEKNASEKRIEDHNGDSSRKYQDFSSSAFQRVKRGFQVFCCWRTQRCCSLHNFDGLEKTEDLEHPERLNDTKNTAVAVSPGQRMVESSILIAFLQGVDICAISLLKRECLVRRRISAQERVGHNKTRMLGGSN